MQLLRFLLATSATIIESRSEAARCSWGYKPAPANLLGTSNALKDDGSAYMSTRTFYTNNNNNLVQHPDGISSGQTQIAKSDFILTRSPDGIIRIRKTFDDVKRPVHVFKVTLWGELPPQAKAKGIAGNRWDMFLYFNGAHASECTMPKLDPMIDSITVQQVKQ